MNNQSALDQQETSARNDCTFYFTDRTSVDEVTRLLHVAGKERPAMNHEQNASPPPANKIAE